MTKSIHNWIEGQRTPFVVDLRCDGHCRATAGRDKESDKLVRFDRYGQLSKKERQTILGFADNE